MMKSIIKPIIEYLPLDAWESRGGANWEILPNKEDADGNKAYIEEVKQALKSSYGVYIFYDSLGRAIYVGKAQEQDLWREIKNAFNRDRGQNQTVYYVEHPLSNNRADLAKYRSISSKPLKLHDLAFYFSAFDVEKKHIPDMEAFLIRSFANNLMNGRIENFPGMKA